MTVNSRIMLQSDDQGWLTPPELLDVVRDFCGEIALDPCSAEKTYVRARREIKPPKDGVIESWGPKDGLAFVNPEYSRELPPWTKRCRSEAVLGREIILLVPARCGTGWWQKYLTANKPGDVNAICFWRGRLRFLRPNGQPAVSATFDSALVYWGPRAEKFHDIFMDYGWTIPWVPSEEREV